MKRPASRFVILAGMLLVAACQAPVRPEPAPPQQDPSPPIRDAPAVTAETPAVAPAPIPTEPAPAVAPDKPLTGADVFARLVARLADPPCVEDRVVQRWEKTYGRWAPRFRSNLDAILPLMAMVMDELEAHHLPAEFALLPIVESWYRPDAGSARTAYGMWQFTTSTARHQGLRIVPGFDERLAPQAATRAAMRYLAELQNRFGDWRLANMAYNAGEYRILRALARSPNARSRPSAASHLPAGLSMTTYEHLAKIQALACLIAEPARFGLELPLDTTIRPLRTITLPPGDATLDRIAAERDLALGDVLRLNPAFLGGRVVRNARRNVLVPEADPEAAASAPSSDRGIAAATPAETTPGQREHRVRSGETLGAIAQRYRVRLADLLRWNRLDVRALIHPGQRLRLEP
jgi:membrane-bound lytic murein transglycosylase D